MAGDVLDIVTDTSDRGGTFDFSAEFKTLGGFSTAKIKLSRYANLVISNRIPCDVYYNDEKVLTGYIDSFTDPSTVSENLEIKIISAWERLKNLELDTTYTTVTLEDVIDDIYDRLLAEGIVTGLYKQEDYSTINIVNLVYDNKPYTEVMDQVLQLVNNEYEQHTVYIDVNGVLRFVIVDTEEKGYLFQNTDYQDGKYKPVPPVANKLFVYTTVRAAGINKQVLTAELTNEISVDAYGVYSKSIVFTNEIDDDTALMMGESILKYTSQNGFDIKLNDLLNYHKLDFKKYVIQTERYEARYAIEGGTDLSQWNLTNLTNTTAEIDNDKYYTGNQSLKLTLDTGSTGEEIFYKSGFLVGVSSINVTYQTTAGATGKLIATDSVGNQLFFALDSVGAWSSILIQPQSGTEDYLLSVDDTGGSYLLEVTDNDGGGDVDYNLKVTAAAVLLDIASIVIRMTSDSGEIYVDQLGVKGSTVGYYSEVISGYKIKSRLGQLVVDQASFGVKELTPLEQLGDSVKRTDLLYNNLASEG